MPSGLARALRTLTPCVSCPHRWSTPPEASRTSTERSARCLRMPSGLPHTGPWGSCGRRRLAPCAPETLVITVLSLPRSHSCVQRSYRGC